MNPESLMASTTINIGLTVIILTLFSILRKQEVNSPIYVARRLSKGEVLHFEHGLGFSRFLPSAVWIKRAFNVTENEIIDTCGLDALVVIRLFKFGINFFIVCSIVGLLLLLPINYSFTQGQPRRKFLHSMDAFSIANVGRASNMLWVHFTCLCFISLYGSYLLHKEYKRMLERRIQHLCRNKHRPDQFTILVREIPICSEHHAHACHVDHFFSKHHGGMYQSYQIVYDGKSIEELLDKACSTSSTIEKLQRRDISMKHGRGFSLLNIFEENIEQLEKYKKLLRDLSQKINSMQHENMLRQKELPVAFVSFKTRRGAALAIQSQQHENPLLWITEVAPEPRDILWNNLAIPYLRLAFHKIGFYVGASLLTIFFTIPVTAVQGVIQLENIKKWFPPARAVKFIPGLSSVITGYLPSAVLNSFIYVVPYALLSMASLEGCVSRSKKEMRTCSMVFYFLVGNVFFLSLLSGSLLYQIGESVTHPRSFPNHLASAVSAQADFFITYILTDAFSGFSLEALQPLFLIWHFVRVYFVGVTKGVPYLFSVPYYRFIPIVSLSMLIGMVYVVVSPLLLPFLVIYFFLGYTVYINQIQDVYDVVYDTCGEYWPYVHHYIFLSIILMQVTMIGLFGLKSKPAASISTIPLLLLTILFNEYCKRRFLPSFHNYPIQIAVKSDELDDSEGLMDGTYNAIDSYRPPFLRPISFSSIDSSLTEPLILST